MEGYSSTGYIPKGNKGEILGNSGVTIGSGIDLGQHTERSLMDLNVSRETSLSGLLASIASNLNIEKYVFNTTRGFSGLTLSAASLILLSIESMHGKPALVVLDTSALAEKLYLACYNLIPDKIAIFPESVKNNMYIPGFNP